MTISDNTLTEPLPLQFKAGLVPLLSLELHHPDLALLEQQLVEKSQQAPDMFKHSPVILVLDNLTGNPSELDIKSAIEICLRYGIHPIAARTTDKALAEQLADLGLARISANAQKPAPNKTDIEKTTVNTCETPNKTPYRIINTPIRSGQQVIAPEGDLIVTAPVSAGAELLAQGNIHVYGALRGRALAGINGDHNVRIFCQSFEAELVAIAGHYCNDSDPKHWKKPVNISLSEDQLTIEPLS